MLTQTFKAAESTEVVKPQSYHKVIVDSTVQEKAIAPPTDSKLLERARQHLVELAAEGGLVLRQNYNRGASKLAARSGRYAHGTAKVAAIPVGAMQHRPENPRIHSTKMGGRLTYGMPVKFKRGGWSHGDAFSEVVNSSL